MSNPIQAPPPDTQPRPRQRVQHDGACDPDSVFDPCHPEFVPF